MSVEVVAALIGALAVTIVGALVVGVSRRRKGPKSIPAENDAATATAEPAPRFYFGRLAMLAGAVGVALLAYQLLRPYMSPLAEIAGVTPPADWSSSTSGNLIHIRGLPTAFDGPAKPSILATCGPGGLSMSIYFGVPMANSHRGTDASLITVDLRLDGGGVIPLVFSPSQDWTQARVLDPRSSVGDALNSAGVTIDNLIFNALGMKKQAPRADWSAERLLRTMAFSSILSLRGTTRSGFAITAQYDLEDLRPIHTGLPEQCR